MLLYHPVKFERERISKQKVISKREKIYRKFVRMCYFVIVILDTSDFFLDLRNIQNDQRNLKFCVLFEIRRKVIM